MTRSEHQVFAISNLVLIVSVRPKMKKETEDDNKKQRIVHVNGRSERHRDTERGHHRCSHDDAGQGRDRKIYRSSSNDAEGK